MNYKHEFEAIAMTDGTSHYECTLCGFCVKTRMEFEVARETVCPERIVQEVVARIRAELQRVNVLPAKRRDRPR